MKRYLLIILFCYAFMCGAQENKYYLSHPLDIKQKGWNKVLCMKNGNTLLFHFEPTQKILVKVFDSTHREIATRRDMCRVVDIFLVEYAEFKGLFEINGEAVLFIEQDSKGRHSLIRLCYNATTGALADERLVGESKNENRRIQYYVMNNKGQDSYEILFCMDKRHPKQSDIFMVYFNSRHEQVREVRLDVERKKYDFLEVLGAEWQPNGVMVTLGLDKTLAYGGAADLNTTLFAKPDHDSALKIGASVFEHYLVYYYIPGDSTAHIKTGTIDMSQTIYPYYTLYTYNPLADALDLLLFSYKPLYFQFGLNWMVGAKSDDMLFRLGIKDMSVRLNMTASGIYDLTQQTDTGRPFQGMPVKMFNSGNGVSTVISQAYVRYGEPETSERYNYQDYFNNIGIMQIDDSGHEVWSATLPMAQYYKSYTTYYNEKDLCKRWQDQAIFGDLPVQVYNRQFVSFNAYYRNNSIYIVDNDYNKNINKGPDKRCDTVYTFDNTNACYYKIDSKRNISKNYLFGVPQRGEYKCSFIEGADFDEEHGVYASLVQYRKNNKTTLRMAWQQMD